MYNTPCSHIQSLSDLRQYGWLPGRVYTTGGRNNKEPDDSWRLVPISLRKRVTVIGLPKIEGFLIATNGVSAALITLEDKYFDGHLDFLKVVADTGFNISAKTKDFLKQEKHQEQPINEKLVKYYAYKYAN